MSGFEVVGVVLGALPLLVEGLKTYRSGLHTVSHMINYEKAIDDLILQFGTDASLYVHICDRLVQPLMLTPGERTDLVDNPNGESWKDQELGRRVQESLERDYQIFMGIAKRLHDRLIRFATNLDLDPANNLKPRWLTAVQPNQSKLRHKFFSKSNRIWKGLKAGFDNGSLEKALHQIEEDLLRLERILDARDREAPTRRQARNRSRARVWNSIRDAACNIYTTLATHWRCPPEHRHVASLRLESRKALDHESSLRFGFIFLLEDTAAQAQQIVWHDVEIEPKTKMGPTQASPSMVSNQPVIVGPFKLSAISAGPKVQVVHAQATHTHVSVSANIQDLCNWQQSRLSAKAGSFGFLEHDIWQYQLYQGNSACHSSTTFSHTSLRDCIVDHSTSQTITSSCSAGLSAKEKFRIATILASSVLQLGQTPWLTESSCDMNEIFLLDFDKTSSFDTSIYIRHEFSAHGAQPVSPNAPVIENTLVFALGVILIELSYEKPLTSFKEPADGNHPYTNFQIASRLVRTLGSREGEKYADVAKRCIKCNFDVRVFSFDSPEFQEQFYTGVVLPLQELRDALQ